jgi:hypothetical protein
MPINKDTPTSEIIHDFVKSKNPKFAGKSKAERVKQAVAASYKVHGEEVEESNNTPYVRKSKTNPNAWDAMNKHGKVKTFGAEFKDSAMRHAGISEDVEQVDEEKPKKYFMSLFPARTDGPGKFTISDIENITKVKSSKNNIKKEETELDEARGSSYPLYHKSYTDAINHAIAHHKDLDVSDEDRMHHVGIMSKKPSEGNTTFVNLPASHRVTGKPHMMHIQVFNRGNKSSHPYELNTYSSGMGRHYKEETELDEAKRGRPRKNPAPEGHEGGEERGPEGMEMKLRKASDYITLGKDAESKGEKNAHPKTVAIQFGNGKTHEIPHEHVMHALKTIESWKGPGKNPDERMKKLADMDKSHEHFLHHMGKMPELKKANEEVATEARGVAPEVHTHSCVTHVYHEQFGEGKTIYSEHAEPDAEGNIAWYDVMFDHGIERQLSINEVKVLNMESHSNHPKKKKIKEEVEQVAEGDTMHTHTAHFSDPASNEWKGKMLLVAENDADAIEKAKDMAKKEGLKLMKVSKNVVVMSDKAIGEETVSEAMMCKTHGKHEGKECPMCKKAMEEEKTLSPKQKKIAALAGDPNKLDAEDFKKLRAMKEEKEPKQSVYTATNRYHAVESAARQVMAQNRNLRQEAKEAEWKKNNPKK